MSIGNVLLLLFVCMFVLSLCCACCIIGIWAADTCVNKLRTELNNQLFTENMLSHITMKNHCWFCKMSATKMIIRGCGTVMILQFIYVQLPRVHIKMYANKKL